MGNQLLCEKTRKYIEDKCVIFMMLLDKRNDKFGDLKWYEEMEEKIDNEFKLVK